LTYELYRGLTGAVWTVGLPWLRWKRRRGGREWEERTGDLPSCRGGLWVHAASVGEVAAAAPLVRELRSLGEQVLLTVMTPTGRSAAERLSSTGASIAFPPLDAPAPVDAALDSVSPRALLIVETELWPNIVVEAASRGVKVVMVNARLSAGSVRRYRGPLFPLTRVRASIDLVACRSEDDRSRFLELGFAPESLTVTGSTKFDAAPSPPDEVERRDLRGRIGADDGSRVVVFGSVRPAEEETVLGAVEALVGDGGVRAVVAPRHLARVANIAGGLEARGIDYALRSRAGSRGGEPVTLLDTTGELVLFYALADVAFVGGTLAPYGGHNPLEPAAVGVPVVIGPHTSSCAHESRLLIERGGALRVADGEGLRDAVRRLLSDEAMRLRMGAAAADVVSSGRGATRLTIDALRSLGVVEGEVP